MYKHQQKVFSHGLDMNCDRVVIQVTFIRSFEENRLGQDCVIEFEGIQVKVASSDLFPSRSAAQKSL